MSVTRINEHYQADTARVTGDVRIGRDVVIWYGVSIRGDIAPIVIGNNTNVQDNAVIHCDRDEANTIGARVTIGHGAIVHGMSVGDDTLIGMGAIVMARSRIGSGCLIAAGTLIPPGMQVPDGQLVMGSPGKIIRAVNDEERAMIADIPEHYVKLARRYVDSPNDVRVFDEQQIRW